MKHLLAMTALATGILASLPGLAQDKTVVSFLHKFPEPENMAYFDAAVAEFEAANPAIDIVMESSMDEPYKDKIRVLMASDQVPDIYFSWSGEFGRKFAREGRTLDLTEALAGPEWQGRPAAASLEPFQFEGKQFGIPVNVDSKYMIYNKAIFEKHAGLAVPTTFADFIALNDALLAAGEVPIAYGNQSPWAATHYIGDLFAKMVPDDVRQADYQLLGLRPTSYIPTRAMSRLWRCTNPSATKVISTTEPTRSRISKRGRVHRRPVGDGLPGTGRVLHAGRHAGGRTGLGLLPAAADGRRRWPQRPADGRAGRVPDLGQDGTPARGAGVPELHHVTRTSGQVCLDNRHDLGGDRFGYRRDHHARNAGRAEGAGRCCRHGAVAGYWTWTRLRPT